MSKRQARRVLAVEVPAASAKVATAEVAAAEAAHVAEVSAGERSPAPMEGEAALVQTAGSGPL